MDKLIPPRPVPHNENPRPPSPPVLPIFLRLASIAAGYLRPTPSPPALSLRPIATAMQRVALDDAELARQFRRRRAS